MKTKIYAGLAFSLLASLAFGTADSFTIKTQQKVGDIHKYKQMGKFEVSGMEIDFSSKSVQKVLKVESNGGYTVKEDVSETKFNGNDAPDQAAGGSTTTYSPIGEVLKIEGDRTDENVYRFANLALFIVPDKAVSIGDSWNFDVKENKTTGSVAAKAKYTLAGEGKVGAIDALQIKFSIKETTDAGASSDGTLWISKADGTLLKLSSKLINAPVQPGVTISGEISVTLIQ